MLALNKVKTPGSPSDFRPKSLLNFLSKALEYIVLQQINVHIETYNIHDCMQTGIRKNNSTQTALIKLTDDIRVGMNRKLVTLFLLFDFSKTFDSVCHVSLLRKLKVNGFSKPALRWIASYLTSRQQAVKGKSGSTSSYRHFNTGVPQGSILGPLLFSLYIVGYCEYFAFYICRHTRETQTARDTCKFPLPSVSATMKVCRAAACDALLSLSSFVRQPGNCSRTWRRGSAVTLINQSHNE